MIYVIRSCTIYVDAAKIFWMYIFYFLWWRLLILRTTVHCSAKIIPKRLTLFSLLLPGMGTKVQCRSYLPGFYSMKDLNEDSSSSNWPMFYADHALANGQYCNGFFPSTITNSYSGYEKYALKQTMLEHEAIFKHQVILVYCVLTLIFMQPTDLPTYIVYLTFSV